MTSLDRLLQIKFNSSELAAILSDEVVYNSEIFVCVNANIQKFDYLRAGRWMDDHILFSMQVIYA